MKTLKYLEVNFIPKSNDYGHNSFENEEYIDLEFYALSSREKSFSNLETLIIGCKLLTQHLCGRCFYLFGIDSPYDSDNLTTTKLSLAVLTENLLPSTPKLKTLIINSMYIDTDVYRRPCTVCFKSDSLLQ